jgi:hypothetical protein
MKRWELAKSKGLNWQVVLIQDCETDIKIMTLESVRRGEDYGTTNKKVMVLINECLQALESDRLKEMVKQTLPLFASRVYLQWLNLYGNRRQGLLTLALLSSLKISIPEKTKETLSNLPIDSVQDLIYNKATPNMGYDYEHEKKVVERVNNILSTSAKEDYSERYTVRASAERQIRYEWQQEQLQKLYESGVDLIWINTHANCSERCQEWQGKLYSISGKSGTIDGISYQPLSNATDRYETTKAGKTYLNGTLTGFNCRHTTTPYKKGNKPTHIPADVIERQRAIESLQRELERKIRQYETRALGWKSQGQTALTKKEKNIAGYSYRHNKDLAKKWQEEYVNFCKESNVAYYPSRLKI